MRCKRMGLLYSGRKSRRGVYRREDQKLCAEELRWEEGSPEAKEEGPGGELFLPGEEGGYVILIKAEDHLGNESIWVSQGLIIDWKAPEIKISLAEDQQEASAGFTEKM